ncbi:hypothetical protein EJ02DRAFT_101247 [Clathrospora elynae]|uniref:Uncharacterized protein n=1 Tax=Clathrospora elynae TaxID=706981 RepID=A0A6A5S8P0_9PLEO|nr:hypothetical protein EJ02DRAFT_101247 [Clathrospora elynae]
MAFWNLERRKVRAAISRRNRQAVGLAHNRHTNLLPVCAKAMYSHERASLATICFITVLVAGRYDKTSSETEEADEEDEY